MVPEYNMETENNNKNNGFSWHNYNESQTKEKAIFVKLLRELCKIIEEAPHSKGRKPAKLRDIIYALCLKTYLNTSSRRVQSDLKLAKDADAMTSDLPFNTLLDGLERPELKDTLRELIEISSMPLKDAESIFAIDATGFSISRYETYFSAKHLKNVHWKAYRKCHAVCGVASNIIVAVDITKGRLSDIKKFEELAKDTARNFKMVDFVADKGYLSKKSYNLIKELGGQAWIPFKKNMHGKSTCGGESYMWRTMFRYFQSHQEEFYKRYHKRSNIESCFSMIKRKFGNNVKCKKEVSQDNEILAKILVHNLCVLIQEIFLSKLDINFLECRSHYIARK